MPLRFEHVLPSAVADPALRRDLLGTWVAVTDAGGSVGFTAPAPRDAVAAELDRALERVAVGQDTLGVLRLDAPDGHRSAASPAIGMGLLVDRGTELCRHWRTVLRVMVNPRHQGSGAGSLLMRGLHEVAADLGLEHLQLTVRGGSGAEGFYARFGYRVVGCHPGAIRVAPGDDRDELMLVAPVR